MACEQHLGDHRFASVKVRYEKPVIVRIGGRLYVRWRDRLVTAREARISSSTLLRFLKQSGKAEKPMAAKKKR
jgi:hypothetical protein